MNHEAGMMMSYLKSKLRIEAHSYSLKRTLNFSENPHRMCLLAKNHAIYNNRVAI